MQTRVLVVGGGVTGLSTAVFLAWHGVQCLLVDRHPDLLIHPRARGLKPRTVELYRQVGLEPAITTAAYAGADFVWTPVRAQTLNDEQYESPDEPAEEDGSDASPCGFGPIDQDKLEVLLRDRARDLGAEIRFSTELTSFTQDDDAVTATITDRTSGEQQTVRAAYLVAADGVGSPVRQQLGIGTDGPGQLYTTMTAIAEADLNPALRGRPASIAYLQQPRPFTVLMAHDDLGSRWVFGMGYDPDRESVEDFSDDCVVDSIRAAAGLPDAAVRLRPQIPGTDVKVLAFPIAAYVADSYRTGRVFLAGDAAHAVPPTGGLGANTGIQDAHNLAWKMAAVLHGHAGTGLLATYEQERRPAGLLTMGQALGHFGARQEPGERGELFAHGAVALGYQYRSAAVLAAADDARPLLPAELSGQPGTRAPHVPILRDGTEISTLDLYGSGWVLLAGPGGSAWVEAASALELPIEAYRFGIDLGTADAAAAHGLGFGGALLVRPDGFVGWRTQDPTGDAAATLARVVHTILAGPGTVSASRRRSGTARRPESAYRAGPHA